RRAARRLWPDHSLGPGGCHGCGDEGKHRGESRTRCVSRLHASPPARGGCLVHAIDAPLVDRALTASEFSRKTISGKVAATSTRPSRKFYMPGYRASIALG